jgi:hypothetical protein
MMQRFGPQIKMIQEKGHQALQRGQVLVQQARVRVANMEDLNAALDKVREALDRASGGVELKEAQKQVSRSDNARGGSKSGKENMIDNLDMMWGRDSACKDVVN